MSHVDGSYREAPSRPRYVCLACEERAAQPGVCPACSVERLPLADPSVRQELAEAAERRLHRRAGKEQALLGAAAFLVTAPLRWMAGWAVGMLLWVVVGSLLMTLAWRGFARASRRSALHEFRRRRAESDGSSQSDSRPTT